MDNLYPIQRRGLTLKDGRMCMKYKTGILKLFYEVVFALQT